MACLFSRRMMKDSVAPVFYSVLELVDSLLSRHTEFVNLDAHIGSSLSSLVTYLFLFFPLEQYELFIPLSFYFFLYLFLSVSPSLYLSLSLSLFLSLFPAPFLFFFYLSFSLPLYCSKWVTWTYRVYGLHYSHFFYIKVPSLLKRMCETNKRTQREAATVLLKLASNDKLGIFN